MADSVDGVAPGAAPGVSSNTMAVQSACIPCGVLPQGKWLPGSLYMSSCSIGSQSRRHAASRQCSCSSSAGPRGARQAQASMHSI